MRVIAAGLFVFVGLIAGIAVVSSLRPNAPVWLIGVGVLLFFAVLTIVALVIFNSPAKWRTQPRDHATVVKELDDQGLLASDSFTAKRAFQVEEFEDEGSHYYIELTDGSVLFLSGQYLYDYEPLDEERAGATVRLFPNSQFVVRRHNVKRYVVDVLCNGQVIEPEALLPAFSADDFRTNRVPDDGQVIKDRTFEQLKAERSKGPSG